MPFVLASFGFKKIESYNVISENAIDRDLINRHSNVKIRKC